MRGPRFGIGTKVAAWLLITSGGASLISRIGRASDPNFVVVDWVFFWVLIGGAATAVVAGIGLLAKQRWAWYLAMVLVILGVGGAILVLSLGEGVEDPFVSAFVLGFWLLAGFGLFVPQWRRTRTAQQSRLPAEASAAPEPPPKPHVSPLPTLATAPVGLVPSRSPEAPPIQDPSLLDPQPFLPPSPHVTDDAPSRTRSRRKGPMVLAIAGAVVAIVAVGGVAYAVGLGQGRGQGSRTGTVEGYEAGYQSGLEDGRAEGRADGYDEGRAAGVQQGRRAGRILGRAQGAQAACRLLFRSLGTSRLYNSTGLGPYRYINRSICLVIDVYV
jgi:hypothetical protein